MLGQETRNYVGIVATVADLIGKIKKSEKIFRGENMVKKEYQNCFVKIITFDDSILTGSGEAELDPFLSDRDWSQYNWSNQ